MAPNFTESTTYITHSYHFVNDVFDAQNPSLARLYQTWNRCLAIVDHCVYDLYGERIKAYFQAHNIGVTVKSAYITEDGKSIETLLEICDWITEFKILRREPVLVIGGGLATDVAG